MEEEAKKGPKREEVEKEIKKIERPKEKHESLKKNEEDFSIFEIKKDEYKRDANILAKSVNNNNRGSSSSPSKKKGCVVIKSINIRENSLSIAANNNISVFSPVSKKKIIAIQKDNKTNIQNAMTINKKPEKIKPLKK